MGTFGGFIGKMDIPEEKREEFTQRVLKVLEQGGMLKINPVNLFGKQIGLLSPVKLGTDNKIYCGYNYFEDDGWEGATYHADTAEFYTGKIGGNEFCDVVLAVYVLYEFYNRSFGLAELDGEIFDAEGYIGWLNYLFDESYTNARLKDPEAIKKVMLDDADDDYRWKQNEEEVSKLCERAQKDGFPPIMKINTPRFLWTSDWSFRFWGLRLSVGNYHLSDDDRAFYWTPDSDIVFSPSMFWWMEELKERFQKILASEGELLEGDKNFTELLMNTLYMANEVYQHIFAFEEMFYEFISRAREREVQAAYVLLQELVEENKEEAEKMAKMGKGCPWSLMSPNLQHYPGRLKIKRYLAILANPALRQELFGF